MFDRSIVKQTSTEDLVAWKEESWILIQEINARDVQSTLFIKKKKRKGDKPLKCQKETEQRQQ